MSCIYNCLCMYVSQLIYLESLVLWSKRYSSKDAVSLILSHCKTKIMFLFQYCESKFISLLDQSTQIDILQVFIKSKIQHHLCDCMLQCMTSDDCRSCGDCSIHHPIYLRMVWVELVMVHTDLVMGWRWRAVRYMESVYSMEHSLCGWS